MKLVKAKKFVSFAVKQILTKHLAPDTICGFAKEKGCFTEMVCSKTLYNYIERGLLKARSVLLTLDERTTRFRHIIKIPGGSTQAVEQGLKALRNLYGDDSVKFFALSQVIMAVNLLHCHSCFPRYPIYYAHPYSAYERG